VAQPRTSGALTYPCQKTSKWRFLKSEGLTKIRPSNRMSRQASKKLSATRQIEHGSESERGDQDDSDNDSLVMLEKDEEEEELARAVLGDVAGFKAQLGQHMDLDTGSEGGEVLPEEDSEGEAGLENVDDAEVSEHDCGTVTEADIGEAVFPRFGTLRD
jgi:hypothetical protein